MSHVSQDRAKSINANHTLHLNHIIKELLKKIS